MVGKTIREKTPDTEDLDTQLIGQLDITVLELMDEIAAVPTSNLPEGAFTTAQFTKHTGLKRHTAEKRLFNAVGEKRLVTKLMTVDGHRARIWWRDDSS